MHLFIVPNEARIYKETIESTKWFDIYSFQPDCDNFSLAFSQLFVSWFQALKVPQVKYIFSIIYNIIINPVGLKSLQLNLSLFSQQVVSVCLYHSESISFY